MPSLTTPRDFRAVQTLPFCYVCGLQFSSNAAMNRDHVPARTVFARQDRMPCLWLPTHPTCNAEHSTDDQKIGQLISLRRFVTPSSGRDRQLRVSLFSDGSSAVTNVDVDGIVWRWTRGFHAALYREFFPPDLRTRALQTPFPRGRQTPRGIVIEGLLPQHAVFVRTIKTNRISRNLDSIRSNNGKLTYECVWCRTDNTDQWMCIFALDLYDWKDLGVTPGHPPRGCAGAYILPSGQAPATATKGVATRIIIPNRDPYDPFAM